MCKKDYYILSGIVFFIIFTLSIIFSYTEYNFKKPTERDYKPLYNKAKVLEEDFSKIFFMDNAEYELEDKQMKVILSEEKIQLELIFNKELNEIVKDTRHDNYMPIKDMILISFEVAFILATCIAFLLRF